MNKYIKGKKYIILIFLVIVQAGVFLMLKFYFFSFYEKEVNKTTDSSEIDTSSSSSIPTSETSESSNVLEDMITSIVETVVSSSSSDIQILNEADYIKK